MVVWAEAIGTWAAAAAAFVAVWFARSAAKAAIKQTELQREIAEAGAQPYVWADIRVDSSQGHVLDFVLGNSGPTVATNVRVDIEPPLSWSREVHPIDEIQRKRLRPGIRSLAPGAQLVWPIGMSPEILGEDTPMLHTVTIRADGPHGPVPRLVYEINMADFRETADQPHGTLHFVRKAIDDLAKEVKGLQRG